MGRMLLLLSMIIPTLAGTSSALKRVMSSQTIFFVDVKIVRFQSGNVPALAVRNRRVKNHEVNVNGNRVLCLIPALLQ